MMFSIDVLLIRTDYKELLGEIDKVEDADKSSKTLLTNIVIALRDTSHKLKQIETEQSYRGDETVLWKNYKQLQNEKLSLLNLTYGWKTVWEPSLSRKFKYIIPQIQKAIDELTNYVMVFEDTLRAHIDILEITKSRENRRAMRKMSYIALLVSVVFSYLTLWETFAINFISTITFPWDISPYLNWLISALLLIPIFWALVRGWRYLTRDEKT